MSFPSANKAFVLGKVEHDPEVREVKGGKEKMGMRIRTTRSWSDREFSTLHRVVIWGKMIDDLRSIKDGDYVAVDGRIDNRSYEVDGVTKWITEIVANDVQVYADEAKSNGETEEDDLPF